jgi:hypothetical protein
MFLERGTTKERVSEKVVWLWKTVFEVVEVLFQFCPCDAKAIARWIGIAGVGVKCRHYGM